MMSNFGGGNAQKFSLKNVNLQVVKTSVRIKYVIGNVHWFLVVFEWAWCYWQSFDEGSRPDNGQRNYLNVQNSKLKQ